MLKQLQDRAQRQLKAEAQQTSPPENKTPKKLLRNKFRLKKDSKEAQEKAEKLSRKEKKRIMKEYDRLSKLSQRELQAYMMLKDPNNEFMRKLTLEGDEGLEHL